MKVALVHDYLIEFGGAERVLVALHQIWPEAPVYTAFYRPERFKHLPAVFKDWRIITGWMAKLPLGTRLVSPLRFVAPLFFENLNLREYDLVISSSNTYSAKAVITRPGAIHLSYIHTPPRALYGYDDLARWRQTAWKRAAVALPALGLRVHDYCSAQRPDYLIANSNVTKQRIAKYYRRESRVIYPPVRVREIAKQVQALSAKPGNYFLALGRFLPPKRLDLAVEACTQLNLPLTIVGVGPEEGRLRRLAGKTIKFVGEVSDRRLWELYSGAKALIFTAEDEDFGITPVEAMAAGTPVIALNQGGVRESILEGKTGVFFHQPQVEALVKVLKDFNPANFRAEDSYQQALKFDQSRFQEEILKLVTEVAGKPGVMK